jgi:5'(3')-deoxyribonucleotidase
MKKLIAFDLDGVLADTLSSFIQFHNDRYYTQLTPKDFHSEYYWEVLQEPKEETLKKFDHFAQTNYFTNIQPIRGAKETIEIISQQYDVIVITARQLRHKKQTIDWIEKHFPNNFKDIYVIQNAF